MPTTKEYRQRADECLELMREANEWYVKTACSNWLRSSETGPKSWSLASEPSPPAVGYPASGALPREKKVDLSGEQTAGAPRPIRPGLLCFV